MLTATPRYVGETAHLWALRNLSFLRAVFKAFEREGAWPPMNALQRRLIRSGERLNVSATVYDVPKVLGHREAPPEERIVLSLFALRYVEEAAGLLEDFIRVLRLVVERYVSSEEEDITLSRADLTEELGLSGADATKLSRILLRGIRFLGGGPSDTDEWTQTIHEPGLIPFLDVHDIDEYLRVEAGFLRQSPVVGGDFFDPDLNLAGMAERLTRPKEEVDEVLQRVIQRGEEILVDANAVANGTTSYEDWVQASERWHSVTRAALVSAYEGQEAAEEFYGAATGGIFRQWGGQTDEQEFGYRQEATRRGINTLQAIRERLEFAQEPSVEVDVAATPVNREPVGSGIFLVHGHDEAALSTVARFLDQVTSSGATILREQPDKGRTLIEKFENHAAEAGYAVVLLTGDDEGRKRGSGVDLLPRARQNVILELGFFIGKLGRGNVALLYEEGVERPSDIEGVLYLSLDAAGAWKTKLGREMIEAGVAIDANKLIRFG